MRDRLHFAAESSFAPEPARRLLTDLAQETPELFTEFEACSPCFLRHLVETLILSPPMVDCIRSHPEWVAWLASQVEGSACQPVQSEDCLQHWNAWLEEGGREQLTLEGLRAFKRREYLLIACRDLAGIASFEDTVHSLSFLADLVIRLALHHCWRSLSDDAPPDLRTARSAEGFAVFALGKLGGLELNYSSDVDLIFCRRASDADGEQRFFTRLGERLIQALSQGGTDGFLYRVDMRLRPYGETGPLVPTFPSLVSYYESWGEAWERQALIKARPVAGSEAIIHRFRDFAGAFTFARQMDDSSLEEIKRVKHRAEREHSQGEDRFHVKQGSGGIRDIEFYVQWLQLIAGWDHPEARGSSTLSALEGLGQAKSLLQGEESTLSLAYLFLRTLEHRLQLRALTPQALIPRDEKEISLIARGLGFGGDDAPARAGFDRVLKEYRSRVRVIVERIYLTPGYLRLTEREEEFAALLSDRAPKERVRELLSHYGFADIDKAWQNIRLIAIGPAGEMLPPRERRSFLEFVFPLLEVLRDSADPDLALHHLESFAGASGNRISFLRTLASRRPHLSRLTGLLALSNLAHQILLRHPEYFDSLARGVFMHEGRSWIEMHREILERLGASPRGERPGAVLRRFRQREMIRIAYRDLAQLAGPIEISGELSELGEACVHAAIDISRPMRLDLARDNHETLHVVALGKLGSRLMHYGSDLDLLFLYETPGGSADAETRARIQQGSEERVERIVELLSAVTSDGVVYDLDLRLRPEGSSGLLARSRESFMDYVELYIEPWERLALVRSRLLNGTGETQERWAAVLSRVVFEHRWNDAMFDTLRHLKRRIETEKNKENRIKVDFKYGKGGVVDLEFLVQWLQIRHGRDNPEVRTSSLTKALPALQSAGALSVSECESLLSAHRFQRLLENRYQLMEEWNSREISRESPMLIRLARSMGFGEDPPVQVRKALLSEWDNHASNVRALVEKYIFGS